jgi:hypothetical protein
MGDAAGAGRQALMDAKLHARVPMGRKELAKVALIVGATPEE